MVEKGKQVEMNITLHIKTLSLKVTDHTPVYVLWQRGTNPSSPIKIIYLIIIIIITHVFMNMKYRVEES